MDAIKRTVRICISILLLVSVLSGAESIASVTAILGAMGEEVKVLEAKLTDKNEQSIVGMRFVAGKMNGRQVVVARTGTGKVNAAMTATLLIEHFNPGEVIFTGVAGGINPDLLPGDIVIAGRTTQHDFGDLTPNGVENWGARNPINGERNPVFFTADAKLLQVAKATANQTEFEKVQTSRGERRPQVIEGIVVTGDVFVASAAKVTELRQKLRADAVEMEGAAVAQICWQHGVPCLVIRSLSDSADANANQDYERFKEIAARNSARLVGNIVNQLHSEKFPEDDGKIDAEKTQTHRTTALKPHEKEFQETLSGATLVGHFTIDGQADKALKEERYTIRKISKMRDDYWLFLARVQYGAKDVTVPLPLEVKWAEKTPVITLTDVDLPGLGTYTARVLIYRGQYAGTWSGGEHGGQLFGRVITKSVNVGD